MDNREQIYEYLKKQLTDRTFRKETGMDRAQMEDFLSDIGLRKLAGELAETAGPDGRFHSRDVLAVSRKYFDCLNTGEPEEGWLQYCYNYLLHQLFPKRGEDELSQEARTGRIFLLQILRGLYQYERDTLPFDPTKNMRFLSESEVEEEGFTKEYLKLRRLVKNRYIYEFMRIGIDITPFNTLGHISGVHYVAMYAGRQLRKANVPVDLAIVSGSAAFHDIGKYGSKKSEERRIPRLHYYYTDQCCTRFGLTTIGHIAANHSTWDLELENLSAESLLLIYADFRVKSTRDENGTEIIHFYSLKEAFDVILNKLENVDEAKRLRYQKVYDKLVDFEEFMQERGVITEIPEGFPEEPPVPKKPIHREMVLLEREDAVNQLKYAAVDHNIRLMSHFHSDTDFSTLLEAARSEHNWKNIRTYISILGEYCTYMSESQKLMTIQFLYEFLAHRESDIRSQAASILGQMVGTFNEDFKKELPEGETLPTKHITNVSLFSKYLAKIIRPSYKLTDQHRKWIENSMSYFVDAVLTHCRPSCQCNYMDVLMTYYQTTDYSESRYIVLLKAMMVIRPEYCSESMMDTFEAFTDHAFHSESRSLRVAAVNAGKVLFRKYQGKNEFRCLQEVLDVPQDPDLLSESLGNLFLDDLKARTPWVVKVANIRLMVHHVSRPRYRSELLHVATHLANLIKVSETVTVRRTAGAGLLEIVDLMNPEQRNELAVELYNGLEIGDYQFSKYIPDYLGIIMLRLPPNELDEFVDSLEQVIGRENDKLTSATINTIGVTLENYSSYHGRFKETDAAYEKRKLRLLYALIKGYAYYDKLSSREAFWVMGTRIFGSSVMSLDQKDDLFLHCYKKLLALIYEKTEDSLEFYNNAAGLNHLYRYISEHRAEKGVFCFLPKRKAAFYPGTFDPFSLGHKAVAKKIRDMGFDVYLALDEFSWSKNTQPRLQRRKIMNMSVADEENIYPFPDDMSVNIANNADIEKLENAFAGRELYIAVGSDVVRNASCYRQKPAEHSIHGMNHIIFARESIDMSNQAPSNQQRYPITGKTITLTLEKYYEDISSTRIRENIDQNRDISNLIDPVAQTYIYDRNLYLRAPAYKHVLQAREINISSYADRSADSIDPIADELKEAGYDLEPLSMYVSASKVRSIFIETAGRSRRMVAYAAAHPLETRELLDEFEDIEIAQHIREAAGGKIAVLGFLFAGKQRTISNIIQITLTEILTELIARDFTYAVYHPVDPAGLNPRIIEALRRQGFVNIAEEKGSQPIYAVDMHSPNIIFRDVETVIKNPFNKNSRVLKAIDDAHTSLLREITSIYPGKLVLSFNTSAVHNKIINKVAEINGVPPYEDRKVERGPYMSVPFGKALADVLVPNTVTKSLHTEKYFKRDLSGFTVRESKHYSPLEYQARMIRSFNRPVILIDDLLHKGFRMHIVDPILSSNGVNVKELVVGVMTGNARDRMRQAGRKAECAYFIPTIKVWLNERDCYPFIGGDSIARDDPDEVDRNPTINLIMPYTTPGFIAGGRIPETWQYSMTCLQNAKNIWQVIETEYQNKYQRKLTLKRIGEVITYRRLPDLGSGVDLDENLSPSACIDNAIERLIRLRWSQKW
ncbi:MAG: hypothetical protein ACOYJJ_02255 [Anaerovoracaceae bacterium]|jgi:nicotinic acid mononucleotide adenylyltransferase